VDHLVSTAAILNITDPTLKMNHALYNFKIKGFLTAVDIIREIGHMLGKI
jgi:hypothetical protein